MDRPGLRTYCIVLWSEFQKSASWGKSHCFPQRLFNIYCNFFCNSHPSLRQDLIRYATPIKNSSGKGSVSNVSVDRNKTLAILKREEKSKTIIVQSISYSYTYICYCAILHYFWSTVDIYSCRCPLLANTSTVLIVSIR